jgi:heterokaryon incompatibility protein (HET)
VISLYLFISLIPNIFTLGRIIVSLVMRLLNVHTFQLEEFVTYLPPYTILSHTWGEGEVTLKDFEKLEAAGGSFISVGASVPTNKPGWKKIRLSANQTKKDGHDYIWIDTFCIDKLSSAELTESINCMYNWYYNAEVCYAYMSDVVVEAGEAIIPRDSDVALTEEGVEEMKNSLFANSKWFKRGWTLQELIAPNIVLFSDKEFNYMGSKDTLISSIQLITGIDIDVLAQPERFLPTVCVARKMSWAARRPTTRPEDEAYCLLGIFGVNMPLIYGEGRKAFQRLQEEIITQSNDQSIFAWNPYSREPMDENGIFAQWPADFISCGKIVRLKNVSRYEPFVWSKIAGLQMTSKVVNPRRVSDGDGSHWFLIPLECRFEDDFRGPIALKVTSFIRPSQQSNCYKPLDNVEYPNELRTQVV